MRPSLLLVAMSLASGCLSVDLGLTERNCDTRLPYYPDQDGDGVGALDTVFIGCEAPSGYVETTGDCDDGDPSTLDCPDTGDTEPQDTGDTEPQDTGDTEPQDTGNPGDTTTKRG